MENDKKWKFIAQCTKSLREKKKITLVILFIWTIKSGEEFWSLHFAVPWIGSSITLRDVITEQFITVHWFARALEPFRKARITLNATYTIKKGKSDFIMTIAICVFFCDVTETGRVASLSAPIKSKVTVEIKEKLKWPLLTRFSKVCLNFHYFISLNYLYSQIPSGGIMIAINNHLQTATYRERNMGKGDSHRRWVFYEASEMPLFDIDWRGTVNVASQNELEYWCYVSGLARFG